ncbi:MAG: lipoyl domain-containing protein [Ferroplasma sp.]
MIIKIPELWDSKELGRAVVAMIYISIGDMIKAATPVCQIMAAKVTMEIPAKFAGKAIKIIVQINSEVEPGDPVIELE